MKTIGLIGGMSWESTIPYYSIINEYMRDSLGGLHSAKIVMYSVEFYEFEQCLQTGSWDRIAEMLTEAAKKLETAGADMILICTNTMHNVFERVQAEVSAPLIHIAEATADALEADGVRTVALLGTRYTMTGEFYRSRLTARGFSVLTPEGSDIELVNDIIFNELCVGKIRDESRREYVRIIGELKAKGAEAVILGCTEIGLLIRPEDSPLKTYDTTVIHAQTAARLALK